MTNQGNRYNEEFEADITRFVQEDYLPVNKMAKDFVVNAQTIRSSIVMSIS